MRYFSLALIALVCMTGCQIRYNYERMPAASTMTVDEAKHFLAKKEAELEGLREKMDQELAHYKELCETYKRFGDDWSGNNSTNMENCNSRIGFILDNISDIKQTIAALKAKLDIEPSSSDGRSVE